MVDIGGLKKDWGMYFSCCCLYGSVYRVLAVCYAKMFRSNIVSSRKHKLLLVIFPAFARELGELPSSHRTVIGCQTTLLLWVD